MKIHMMTVGAVLLAASVSWAQTAPRLPADYDILMRTSIFSRDRQVQNRFGDNTGRLRQPRTQRVRVYTPILAGAMVEDDGYFVAFIADPGTGLMTGYRIGDVLPSNAGTIKDITLDDITTIAADHTTKKIDIGETITGGAAEYPSDSSPATTEAAAPGPDGGGDNGGGAPPGDNNGPSRDNGPPAAVSSAPGASTGGAASGGVDRLPGETTLDYMRRRRAQQLKK
jgi:hypothetical protein